MKPTFDPVAIARQFIYVREAQSVGQNRGLRVEAIQKWAGGAEGDSWCMEFVWMVLDIAYQGLAPFGRMQSCEALLTWAVNNKDSVRILRADERPAIGDLFLYQNAAGIAHHVGFVTDYRVSGGIVGVAGNTSPDGTSSNGDGVYEHIVRPQFYIDYTS